LLAAELSCLARELQPVLTTVLFITAPPARSCDAPVVGPLRLSRRDFMAISKRGLLVAATAAGLAAGGVARAQTPSMSKSTRVAKIDEGEAIKIYPQTGGVHKSNTKVSAEKHLAALGKGAREISKNTVIYKQGGKMYMYDYQDEANTEAAENFQSQFDNDY